MFLSGTLRQQIQTRNCIAQVGKRDIERKRHQKPICSSPDPLKSFIKWSCRTRSMQNIRVWMAEKQSSYPKQDINLCYTTRHGYALPLLCLTSSSKERGRIGYQNDKTPFLNPVPYFRVCFALIGSVYLLLIITIFVARIMINDGLLASLLTLLVFVPFHTLRSQFCSSTSSSSSSV